MLSRRRFLRTSSVVSLSPLLPSVFTKTAYAAGNESDAKTLVVIQLDGGNDGLNTVVPFGDDEYARARNKLRLPADKLHKLDDYVGLHPSMRAAKELFDDGRLSIVQGVGYPNPDRSHFRSMKIWQTASFENADHDGYGWLGRALDAKPKVSSPAVAPGAIYVGDQETPVALWGRRSQATALSREEDLRLLLNPAFHSEPSSAQDDSLNDFVSRQTLSAVAASEEFNRQQKQTAGSVSSYPNTGLGRRLRLISQVLKGKSQARVYYTAQSGYDTHQAQLYTHSRLLQEFSDAVKAFLDDIKSAKLDDRVVVLAFSEFGRRVKENNSLGTDHGTAGPVFLAGAPVAGGLLGTAPDLANLDDGDLRTQVDFRRIYSTLLSDWLDIDAASVLAGTHKKLPLLCRG
ncbi:hypothetical protein Mal64_06770 [Pseudobythopirellula maris]|uniref:DUF1501 domain-containing protein n=1 Tax=Pseudobythopirellula maris TaxID=2527991 RepID=A0A5C5ZRX7_9BACT|nr:DUF1501 domain-containing protein [Pseudobythopirellula maris]TWT90292.1 hypothetical protein Mal64_06770 [Pseudobythopirellula maris]